MHKFDVRVNENQTLECDIGIQRDNKLDITVDGSQLPSHDTVTKRDFDSNIGVVRFILDAVITIMNLVKRFFVKIRHQFTLKANDISSLAAKFIGVIHGGILLSSMSTGISKFIKILHPVRIDTRSAATLNKFTGITSGVGMLSKNIGIILGKLISASSKLKLISSNVSIFFGKSAKIVHKFRLNTTSRISLTKFITISHVVGVLTLRRPRLLVEIDPIHISSLDNTPLDDVGYSDSVHAVLSKATSLISISKIASNIGSATKKFTGMVNRFIISCSSVATLIGKNISTKYDFTLAHNAKGILRKYTPAQLMFTLLSASSLLTVKYTSLHQKGFRLKTTIDVALRRFRRISEIDTVTISQLDSMAIEEINFITV